MLTQDIDKEGNLVGITENIQQNTSESISVADIRSELFDGENVITGKTDYGQSQLKSGPFAKTE